MKSINAGFCLYLLILFTSCNLKLDEYQSREMKYKQQLETYSSLIDFILLSKIEEIKLENYVISDTLTFLINGIDSLDIQSMMNKKYSEVLFFVYSSASCNSCIQVALEEIENIFFKNKGRISKIFIISSFSPRDAIIFKEMHKWDYSKINVVKGPSTFVNRIGRYPTFFTLSPNNKLEKVFIHDQSYTKSTVEYLELTNNF